ncbi:MAG: ParA family protein [Isosphaeraceae bacterium]|nr:ParA family protein [Isosphaeraceae bacterium]
MQTIAIISQKGGAGKTTIGTHLAVAAVRRGFQTALFDLDPQASASTWSDKRKAPSPTVISAQAARLPSLLEQARSQAADLVIIDSAPNADAASLAAARAADLILIPCRPASFNLGAIGTTLNLAAVAGKPAFVVLNAVPPLGRVGEEARKALGAESKRDGSAIGKGRGPGKRDRFAIGNVKESGTEACRAPSDMIPGLHSNSAPLFAADPAGERPIRVPIFSRSPSAIPPAQTAGLAARFGAETPVPDRRRSD